MRICRRRPMPETALPHMQYTNLEQQRETSHIGMWLFLATEVMFFGVLMTAFTYFHHQYPEAWAQASRHTDFWLGSANTAVLLISSLTMALAVQAAKEGKRQPLVAFLIVTMILGSAFLGCKAVEYYHHITD